MKGNQMSRGGIGVSLLLIAVGAILTWAVSVDAEGFNINTIGLILLVVGVVGLLISLLANFSGRDNDRDVTIVER
ncbi:MAG: hypothetical protein WB245_09360 [Acidimicrobiia bacterium]